ncbi:MAG: hypothetical protein ACHP7N_11335 [Caulobacterales bacterium]
MASVGMTVATNMRTGDVGLNPRDRAEWCTLVRRDGRLEPGARLLLLEVAEHIHRGGKGSRTPHLAGYCWASQATLAGLIGAGERMAPTGRRTFPRPRAARRRLDL